MFYALEARHVLANRSPHAWLGGGYCVSPCSEALHPTPVNRHDLAGHVARQIRSQKRHDIRDLSWGTCAPDRHFRKQPGHCIIMADLELLGLPLYQLPKERRINPPRRYGIYENVVADNILGKRLGEIKKPGIDHAHWNRNGLGWIPNTPPIMMTRPHLARII